MQLLVDRFGWQRYAHKHYESRFTRFYEGYWLPTQVRLRQAPRALLEPDPDEAR